MTSSHYIQRYGRGIPAGGTNYSGILECPCTSNYAGSPEFYGNDTKTKQLKHQYSAIGDGVCAGSQSMYVGALCGVLHADRSTGCALHG